MVGRRRQRACGAAIATSSSSKNGVTASSRSRTGRLTMPTSRSFATTARVISGALPVTTTSSVAGWRDRKRRRNGGSK